jgi:hypothetical protein
LAPGSPDGRPAHPVDERERPDRLLVKLRLRDD